RRRGHGGADPPSHRRRPRGGRQLLSALPPARSARTGRSRVSAPGGVREPQAPIRPRAALPEHDVEGISGDMNPLRIIAAVYAVLFAIVTSLNYIPGLTDAQAHFRPFLPRHLRRRPARGLGRLGRARRVVLDAGHDLLLPVAGPALLPRGLGGPRPRLRLSPPRDLPAGGARPAIRHARPDEFAPHPDRRLRRFRRLRTAPAPGSRSSALRIGSPPW